MSLLAVDALERGERRRADHHVRSCHRCRRDLDAHRDALAALVADLDPPADRVWAGIVTRLVGNGSDR